MDDFTESQKKFMKQLFENLNVTIHEKTSEIREELKSQVNDIKEEIASVINNLQQKTTKLEKENQSLKENIRFLDRKVRKNNLVVFGIDRNAPVIHSIVGLFNDILEIEIKNSDINDAYRLNTKDKNKNPPVLVEFISFQQKLTVLKNAKKLKGKTISIANDLCYDDREANKLLRSHLKQARIQGKTAFIKGNNLIIENDTYTYEQLRSEELEEQVLEIVEKTDSAPLTPNPESRQKRLLYELGLGETRELKEAKTTPSKGLVGSTKSKIQTRANSTSRKGHTKNN